MNRIVKLIKEEKFSELIFHLDELPLRLKKAHYNLIFEYKYRIAKNYENNLDKLALVHQFRVSRNYNDAIALIETVNIEKLQDLERLYYYQSIGFLEYYFHRNISRAVLNLEIATQISVKRELDYFKAKIALELGIYLLSKHNPKPSTEYFTKALVYFSARDESIFKRSEAKTLINFGVLYSMTNNIEKAIAKTELASKKLLEIEEYETFVASTFNLSNYYEKLESNEKGIELLEYARIRIKKIEEPMKSILQIRIFKKLAESYQSTSDLEKVFYYGNKIKNNALSNIDRGIAFRYIALANTSLNDIDKSIEILKSELNYEYVESLVVKGSILESHGYYAAGVEVLNSALTDSIENNYRKLMDHILYEILRLNCDYVSPQENIKIIHLISTFDELLPDNLQILIAKTWLYTSQFDKFKSSMSTITKTKTPEILELQGFYFLLIEEYDDCEKFIKESIDEYENELRFQDLFNAYLILCILYYIRGENSKILKILKIIKQQNTLIQVDSFIEEIILVEILDNLIKNGILKKYKAVEKIEQLKTNKTKIFTNLIASILERDLINLENNLLFDSDNQSYQDELQKKLIINMTFSKELLRLIPGCNSLLNQLSQVFPLQYQAWK